MSNEDLVTHSIMRHLQKYSWNVVQYHSPGGQASMSINIQGELVVPDIIAHKSNHILVAENKYIFSDKDIHKLNRLRTDDSSCRQIKEFIERYDKSIASHETLKYHWVHGFYKGNMPNCDEYVIGAKVNDRGEIRLIQSMHDVIEISN